MQPKNVTRSSTKNFESSGISCTDEQQALKTNCYNALATCRADMDKSNDIVALVKSKMNPDNPDFQFEPKSVKRSHLCSVPGLEDLFEI